MTNLGNARRGDFIARPPTQNGGSRYSQPPHQPRDTAGEFDNGFDIHEADSRIFRRPVSSPFVGSPDTYFSAVCHIVGMTNLKAIGARVKWLRISRTPRESQEQLAAAIGVTRSAIAGIESGGDRGGLETMIAIADYYKVPLDWLLCREIPPGGPLVGEFIDDPDELAFAHFWRGLGDDGRAAALAFLRIDLRGSVTSSP